MPYHGDEFFPDGREREETNDNAAYELLPYEALRVLAPQFGMDDIADAITAAARERAADEGVDSEDIDSVLEDAGAWIIDAAHAASELPAQIEAAEKRHQRRTDARIRDARRAA